MAATLRLTDELSAQLALMARVDRFAHDLGLRRAFVERFERCRADVDFQKRASKLRADDWDRLILSEKETGLRGRSNSVHES